MWLRASPVAIGKESTCNAGNMGDTGLIPGSGRSPGEGNGNSLQYSCLGIQQTEELGGLQSLGSKIVRQNLATEQRAAVRKYQNLDVLKQE